MPKLDLQCCDTGLAARMLTIAEAEQLPDDHELVVRAHDFEEAVRSYYIGRCSRHRFLSIWVRARRAYIEFRGEADR